MIIYSSAAALLLCLPAHSQRPEIIEQTPTKSSSLIWGGNENWIAALSKGGGALSIFDLSSGRLARRIGLAAAGNANVTFQAIPDTDELAISLPQSIDIYNVLSGERIASVANSAGCRIASIENGQLTGKCSNATGFHPFRALQRTWDLKTGKLIREEQLENQVIASGTFRNGSWIAESRYDGLGKQMLHSFGRGSSDPETNYFRLFRFSISDRRNQQVLLAGAGRIVAISASAGTAIVASKDGVWLVQVPSSRHLQQLGEASLTSQLSLTAQPVLGGKQYLLTNLTGSFLINASTGQVTTKALTDALMTAAGAVSPSGTRFAYPQGTSVLIVSLLDTAQRQTLGVATPEAVAAEAAFAAATKDAMVAHLHGQEPAATIQNFDTFMKPYLTFGGPSILPPLSQFLDSGRIFAVLTADASWNMWDTATGNRLSSKTQPDLYGLSQAVSGTFDATNAMASFLEDKLAELVPGSLPRRQAIRSGDHRACSARDGMHVVDLRTELNSKKSAIFEHRIVASAILHSASGTAIDLLAKGIDLSALADNVTPGLSPASTECSLSDDGQYLVIERLLSKSTGWSQLRKQRETLLGQASSESLVVFQTSTGQLVSELEGSEHAPLLANDVVFSPDNQRMAAARLGRLHLWQVKSGRLLLDMPMSSDKVLGFSDDSQLLYTSISTNTGAAKNSRRLPGQSSDSWGIQILHAGTGRLALSIPDAYPDIRFLKTTPNGQVLFGPNHDNALGFWDAQTGEPLASMRALQQGEWLVTTPQGFFDGSPRGWTQVAWRLPGKGLITEPAEIFFNDFYRPGLLAELLQGHPPIATRSIQDVDRRQPAVALKLSQAKLVDRQADISVSVQEAPPDEAHPDGSGVRDVRLFRNGMLVKVWRGDAALQSGHAVLQAGIPLVAGENHFSAYAFNHDNIKSADATAQVTSPAHEQPGTAYILTIGVNRYANAEFNLKFARSDAEAIAQAFSDSQNKIGKFASVVIVKLLDQDATKANISLALSLLAGTQTGALPPGAPSQLTTLKRLGPQDQLLVYFAGHGIASGDRFYLVPHDLGYTAPRRNLPASLETILRHSLSDQDLEAAFEPMQAGSLLLIIDACNSGKALESDEDRRGPLNNRGLAQLAYEKGIYVLTAAQSYQAALESSRLGHGYLTYALSEEGLKTRAADESPADGKITASEWFRFASRRVPELQADAIHLANEAGRQLTFDTPSAAEDRQPGQLQTPRWYYRRDFSGPDLVVAIQK